MYRIFPLYIVIILLAVSELRAQPFETVSSSITGVGRSTVAWGDYDVDGDLDLIISGMTNSGSYLSRIYENDSGTFIINQSELQGVKDGSVAWGDFDNDNDLDVLLTGETEGNGNISLIYRNDDGVFTEYDAGLPEVGYGDAS
ncbi:MAG: VCBS repeat-containing protein, partial [Bacteroidota bacterium]